MIRRTAVEVDPAAVGYGVLAYVTVDSTSWMGDSAEHFAALPEILEAHVIAGSASVLVKVRTATASSNGALRSSLFLPGACRLKLWHRIHYSRPTVSDSGRAWNGRSRVLVPCVG